MKTATTLLEISKILKLSPSTVSRALKNHPDIAPSTKQKVLELADKLDYEPNLNAVGLRTSATKEIAVIVPNLSGFFYDSFISAVEEETRRIGYSLIVLLSGDNPAVETENTRICRQRRVEGVLVCITPETNYMEPFEKLQRLEIPVVFFDKIPAIAKYNTIRVADEEAATIAANFLIENKRENVMALFGDLNMSITARRLHAFQDAFEKKNKADSLNIRHAPSFEVAETVLSDVFASGKKPDAVFCMSDEILIGVMKAVQRLQIRYPEEVSIVAISNGFFPRLYYPEVTYVETSGFKLGKLAFARIMEMVNGDGVLKDLTVPAELVESKLK